MLIPELRQQRQVSLCEFKAVVYRGSSRPARVAEGNPVSKNKQASKQTVLSHFMLFFEKSVLCQAQWCLHSSTKVVTAGR